MPAPNDLCMSLESERTNILVIEKCNVPILSLKIRYNFFDTRYRKARYALEGLVLVHLAEKLSSYECPGSFQGLKQSTKR